jgi:hypothetical protein
LALNKLSIDLSPKEQNDRLLKAWGISLFRFAQVLAMCANDSDDSLQLPERLIIRKEKILKKKKLLLALKKDLLKRIPEIDAAGWDLFQHEGPWTEDEVIKVAKLEPFFELYFNPLIQDTIKTENEYTSHQGARITKRSLLAAAWGGLIYQSRRPMDWDSQADLYEWFWMRLKDYAFYKCIEPPEDLVNYLTVQFHRYKENPDSEYCRIFYGSRDYLTIFAPNGTFVDRGFEYSFESFSRPLYKKGRSPELPDENEEVVGYFKFALELYSGAAGQTPIPPLIIFPDKSHFSTAF